MIAINVSHNIDQVIRGLDDIARRQIPFATARALTQTAKAMQAEVPGALQRALDRPTEFTKRGTFVQSARKDKLVAVIGFKDRQAVYMRNQIAGGVRSPTRKALRLPANVARDVYGNLPRGTIQKLIAAARGEKKLAKRTGKRLGVSNRVSLFYGQPEGGNFPAGIYKRVVQGERHVLIPVVVFPQRSARYKPRFDFAKLAREVVARQFHDLFKRSLREALATTR